MSCSVGPRVVGFQCHAASICARIAGIELPGPASVDWQYVSVGEQRVHDVIPSGS